MGRTRIVLFFVILIGCYVGAQFYYEQVYLRRAKQSLRRWLASNYQDTKAQHDLSQRDASMLPLLIELLRDQDERVIINALQTLAEQRAREAVPAVTPLLSHDNWRIRFFAAQALMRLSDRTAVDSLLSAWKNEPEWQVSREIALALAKLGDQTARPAMEHAFQHTNGRRKLFSSIVLFALSESDSAKRYLERFLTTAEPHEKKLAMWTLADTGNQKAKELLKLALRDDDATIREAARGYLNQLLNGARDPQANPASAVQP